MELKVPPPVQMLVFAMLMVLFSWMFSDLAVEFPFQAQVAIASLGLGLLISVAGIAAFAKAKTTVNPMTPEKASKLVIVGVFKVSRNPMYLGMFFILLACTVYLGNALNLVVLGGFVLTITHFQIKPEEKALIELFGDSYQEYLQSVRRWI